MKLSSIVDVGLFGVLDEGWNSDEWEDGGRDAVGGKILGCQRSTHHNPHSFLTERTMGAQCGANECELLTL